MNILRRKDFIGDGLRFLIAGLINTGLTLLVFQVLVFYVSSTAAYAISWLIGLAFVAAVHPARVFIGGRRDYKARSLLIAFYAVLFLLGLSVLKLLEGLGVASRFAIFIVTGCTTLANFITSRSILRRV